jgi:hypothetical protein
MKIETILEVIEFMNSIILEQENNGLAADQDLLQRARMLRSSLVQLLDDSMKRGDV